ncbi:MAG: S9 family peptidase [Gemmatimonadetes bacterium]|nr:S9 family peptidase [Gemmatimonadota bacterium]
MPRPTLHAPRALRAGIVALALLAPPSLAAQKHPMGIEDLALLRNVADPALSPDGRWVAYTVTTTDYAADRARTEVVIAPAAGGEPRRVAEGGSPRWSPDGRTLAFRGGRGEQAGIWLYTPGVDSARFLARVQTTDHFLGHRAVKGFAWSPDGTRIAYVSADPPAPQGSSDVRVVRRILYKTRTGLSDNRLSHLWVVPVAGGEPRQVTRGSYDEHSLSWAPDSRRLVFISNRSPDPDANYSDDLWIVDVDSGRETQLTRTVGTEFQPAWSPDGRSIAYLGNVRAQNTKDSSPEDTHLYLIPADGGAPRMLAPELDRRVAELVWDPGSRSLLAGAGDRGMSVLYRVPVDGGRAVPVVQGEFQARSVATDGRGRTLAFLRSDQTHPTEVWIAGADGRGARQLSHMQDADSLWVQGADGTPVQGWLMKPADWQPGRRYPMVLYVHGGPHGMYGYTFTDAFQLLAARGYAVLFLNPRGSSGYGQHFTDGVVMNWGGGDYQDLMAGVDAALARNPWIDRERLGVVGSSYGGFMTNWIITQTPRFRGAVASASVSDLVSFYGTSLYSDLVETEFNGVPWKNYAMLWQWSPLAHVEGVRTPTLFLHGESDHDVPITQAEEMYMALRKQGVDAEMARYPGEGHGIAGPQHRVDYLTRMIGWFDRYVKGGITRTVQE